MGQSLETVSSVAVSCVPANVTVGEIVTVGRGGRGDAQRRAANRACRHRRRQLDVVVRGTAIRGSNVTVSEVLTVRGADAGADTLLGARRARFGAVRGGAVC